MLNRNRQYGMTMIGMLFVAIILIFVAVTALKLIPAYTEFFEIRKILKDIGGEVGSKGMTNVEIREKFDKRADIDNITSVKSSDLQIDRSGGRTIIFVEYTFKTGLVGNVSLLADFSASSDGRESKMAQQLE